MRTIEDVVARKLKQKPQLDYMWRVTLPALNDMPDSTGVLSSYRASHVSPIAMNRDNVAGSLTTAQEVSDRVIEVNQPFVSFKVEDATYGPVNTSGAGAGDIGTMTLIIDEHEDGYTLRYINQWMGMIANSDKSRNPPAYYRRNISFLRLGADESPISTDTYIDCFPIEINPVANSYENNDVLKYSVTISVDDVKHTNMGGSESTQQ